MLEASSNKVQPHKKKYTHSGFCTGKRRLVLAFLFHQWIEGLGNEAQI